jgi:hypothetical protein
MFPNFSEVLAASIIRAMSKTAIFIHLFVYFHELHMDVSFQEETRENMTVSDLSFVPTTDDDGKSITCRAENPNITGAFLESSWKIDVVCKSLFHDPN